MTPDAAHLPPAEQPHPVADILMTFFHGNGNGMTNPGLADDERREQGMSVRRAVLSDAHVDRATATSTELTADGQDFITRVACVR